MCYSAQIWQNYKQYLRAYGAEMDIQTFVDLFWSRLDDDTIKIPKALEVACVGIANTPGEPIRAAVANYQTAQATALEQALFKQRKRLADAQRSLQTKLTRAATESQRIATAKIAWCQDKLANLRRTDLVAADSRIYPGYFAPVMLMENGKRVLKPMRYQCRPAGKPAGYDSKFPGTYNARRDSLEGYWKGQFGVSHGLVVVNAFYEHVSRQTPDGIEKLVLEFKPQPAQDMLVACLWSHWRATGQPDLWSFAAITDEPPPEVAAAGHDRCVIPIKPKNIDAWLNPDSDDLALSYAILDDRERPYYEHRSAA